jgi:ELWxxDGT repeat protein
MRPIRKSLALLAIAPALAAPLLAQPHYLVADVNQLEVDAGSIPDDFVAFGGAVYFTASDDRHGEELWRSDGTGAGTYRVRDICSGRCSSRPLALTAAGGWLYFLAYSGTTGLDEVTGFRGTELWRTDGTRAGTELVRRVCSQGCYSGLRPMVAVDGALYFQGSDPEHGNELWRSDGTAAGTGLLLDVRPGPGGSFPDELTAFAGRLLFRANDGAAGEELWQSDGTAPGTELLADVCPGACSSRPQEMGHLLDDVVTFAANDGVHGEELWVSDGTAAGTVRASDLPGEFLAIDDLVRLGDRLYFAVRGGSGTPRGWKSDGTLAGTEPAPELLPLGPGLLPTQLRVAGGNLFFTLRPSFPREGRQLWATDGSAAGTELLAELPSTTTLGTVLGDRLVFAAYADETLASGSLWISDGTPRGTEQLHSATPYRLNFRWQRTAVVGGEMLFGADDGASGFELWHTDGSAGGTAMVRQIQPARSSSDPRYLTSFAGRLFFAAFDGVVDDRRLWRSDGTAAGTEPAEPLLEVSGQPVAAGDRLFFAARGVDSVFQPSLWASDGAPDAAVLLAESRNPRQLSALGGLLLFAVSDPGQQIWRSDGTPAGTSEVEDVHPGWFTCPFPCGGPTVFPPDELTASGQRLFFTALEDHLPQLWRSDGTESGTSAVADFPDYPVELTDLDGTLVFSAFDPARGQEPWISHGTPQDTKQLADLAPGAASSSPRQLTRAGSRVYFVIAGDGGRDQLWATDGIGAFLIDELQLGAGGARVGLLAAAGRRLFLTVEHESTGEELWISDGTAGGTHLVADLLPGPIGSRPRQLAAFGSNLLFAADDGVHGQELWLSDGTAAGTRLLADVVPGTDASDPTDFTVVGKRVFFAASDPALGRELFAIDPPFFKGGK